MGHIDTNLHPVMQQALAPFVQSPKSRAIRKSTQTFWYCMEGVDLECELDYQGPTGDGWNEPHDPACADLCEAFVGGVDIYSLLDDDQRTEIETAFLETDRSDE